MNALLNPVGPRSPSVYWRRRVAVLAALVVLLLVIFMASRVVLGGGEAGPSASAEPRAASTPAGSQSPTPSSDQTAGDRTQQDGMENVQAARSGQDATASATGTESPGDAQPCEARAVRVSATADSRSYQPGQRPKLAVMIRNVGDGPCSLDAGSKAVELTVLSGGDRVWSSDDCQRDATSKPQTLEPGAELRSSVTWDARRSTSGCPADLPAASSGAYELTGRVGDVTSEPVSFRIG